MTALEISTGLIEKLHEENRTLLGSIHEATEEIKKLERDLVEKDRIIKYLQTRIQTKSETDGILETNKQKELAIKHLNMQIKNLLKENEELEHKMETVRAEICARCENKLLLRENNENKSVSKLNKPTDKKVTSNICPNSVKSLKNIIEHKNNRIASLSKEVQRLTKVEKELTQKINKLTKMIPKSHLSSEALTDCLLNEIQLLESKEQSNARLHLHDELYKLKSKSSVSHASVTNGNIPKPKERFKKSGFSNAKQLADNMAQRKSASDVTVSEAENEVLFKTLQKLCDDVNELKHLYMFESKKFSEGLNCTVKEYEIFKLQLEEVINNLNDIAEKILNNSYFKIQHGTTTESDDKYVISCLQQRLKESEEMVADYGRENKILTENLNCLKKQLSEQSKAFNSKKSEDKRFMSHAEQNLMQSDDVEKLKKVVQSKEQELEHAQSHINTCQKLIDELQKSIKSDAIVSEKPCGSRTSTVDKTCKFCEKEKRMLRTELSTSDTQIKNCLDIIDRLHNTIKLLEDENERLELQLHKAKTDKQAGIGSENEAKTVDAEITYLRKLNEQLQDKIKNLEEINSKCEADIMVFKSKNLSVEAAEQEKDLMKAQLEDAEKKVSTLEQNVKTLKDKLEEIESRKNKLEADLQETNHLKDLAKAFDIDVATLQNELKIKQQEILSLTNALHTLENKALDLKHYRKALHQEIEKLCEALIENGESEDSERRKAIYKAAVLHSAQALLRLDNNYNFKPEDADRDSVLDEMKHQIEVYLTEVSRIHELVTIKEQERDELLREYLDLDDNILRSSSSLHHDYNVQEEPLDLNVKSYPNFSTVRPAESDGATKSVRFTTGKMDAYEAFSQLKLVEEELANTKSVTNYLLSSCARLEDLLSQEKGNCRKYEEKLAIQHETIKDLKSQLIMKDDMTKNLSSVIDRMQRTECNNELALDKLKRDINNLLQENEKGRDRINAITAELDKCKNENAQIQKDLNSLKRQLNDEKYENAKINNEMKRLRLQISQYRSTLDGSS